MNVISKKTIEFVVGAVYRKYEVVRKLKEMGYTDEAKVEFPGSESVEGFERRNKKPLKERLPESCNDNFFVAVSQMGKLNLSFRYDPRDGYLYLG